MNNFNDLNVSLTKHGAHKIARLLKLYPCEDVLNHLNDSALDISIDEAQAKKNLNIFKDNIPFYWNIIRQRSDLNIYILLSIIFSHHSLIDAMINSNNRYGCGIIIRDEIIEGKAYTNIANVFNELGYSTNHTEIMFEYNISYIFTQQFATCLLKQIIKDKFLNIGIPENMIEQELIEHNINGVFGLTRSEFLPWLNNGLIDVLSDEQENTWGENYSNIATPFNFTPRHLPRNTAPITIHSHQSNSQMNQLHAKIQNELYCFLKTKTDSENIGTEIQVNYQNKIDLVEKDDISYKFYEIKTSHLDRKCIREALPQLLEYAYWPNTERCHSLIIVAPADLSNNGLRYIKLLRSKFSIPLFYLWFDKNSNTFIQRD